MRKDLIIFRYDRVLVYLFSCMNIQTCLIKALGARGPLSVPMCAGREIKK